MNRNEKISVYLIFLGAFLVMAPAVYLFTGDGFVSAFPLAASFAFLGLALNGLITSEPPDKRYG